MSMHPRRYVAASTAIILLATLAAHGWSLDDGLFLDDHLHWLRMTEGRWSLRMMTEATTIEPSQFMHAWWQDRPVRWEYFRPIAVLLAKGVHDLTAGSVAALHGVSVLLHFINAMLVYALCIRLTRQSFWSVVGALLFVVYSHSVYAVGWLAAQNVVLQTTLTLGALLCYTRASGLDLHAAPGEAGLPGGKGLRTAGTGMRSGTALRSTHVRGSPVAMANAGLDERQSSQEMTAHASEIEDPQAVPVMHDRAREAETIRAGPGKPPRLRPGSLAAAGLFWLLALGTRETAVVLPVLMAACDLAFGGRKVLRARWPVYAVALVIAGAFMAWRLSDAFAPLPDFYTRRPDGLGYLPWLFAKLLHYLTSAVWLSPMMFGPTVRLHPFQEVPGDCLLMIAILGIMGTGYVAACRRLRGFWIWPLWIILAVLPVLPVMATPHTGYFAGVGFAIAMVLGPALRKQACPVSIGRWAPGVAIWFLVATTTYMPIYRTMWGSVRAAERLTIARVADSPPPTETTEVFFINLPFVNVYAPVHLNETLADRDYLLGGLAGGGRPCCHVLTYASHVLRMDDRCVLEQIDAHRFSLRMVDGRGFFSGAMGRFLLEAMADGRQRRPGQVVAGKLFTVTVGSVNDQGVQELIFHFRQPLASDRFIFYLTSNACGSARVKFWGDERAEVPPLEKGPVSQADLKEEAAHLRAGQAAAARTLMSAVKSDRSDPARRAWSVLQSVGQPVAAALAAPERDILAQPEPGPEQIDRLWRWWYRSVDDETLANLWLRRDAYPEWRHRRGSIARIRGITRRIIETDLYTTGPPFPGPRP